jgi:uncharacterized protein (TIGR00369 family)
MASDSKTPLLINNPFLEWMGVTLVKWAPGYAEMHLPMSTRLGNRTGRVHGGVICTLLDSVSGYSGLYAAPGEPPLRSLTLSLTTNFIGSGEGEILVAKGYTERKGRSVFFTRAEVLLDDSLLMATAVGTFKYSQVK